jgi:predicted transcriptional regulator
MEQETLFTASKWDILKMLSSGPKSPLQLSKLSNTSVANISQQLRLLEMAGLVQSKRISNRDKGQPRQLYSLVGNHSFLIASTADFVDKKLLKLSDYNKIILKIWFIENAHVHYYLEKAFWTLDNFMPQIQGLFVDKKTYSSDPIVLTIVSDSPAVKKELKKISVKNSEGMQKTIVFNVKTKQEFSKSSTSEISSLYAIYDPQNLARPDKKNSKEGLQ